MSSVNTSLTLKYNKTLKALPSRLYESMYPALGEALVTNAVNVLYGTSRNLFVILIVCLLLSMHVQ